MPTLMWAFLVYKHFIQNMLCLRKLIFLLIKHQGFLCIFIPGTIKKNINS